MPETRPDLSVVIACYNEAEHLRSSVDRLLATCDLLALRYEVIFVDDASRDATRDILAELPSRYPRHDLRVLVNETNRGRGATVMRGLAAARAPIAGFLDIDLEVDAAYVLPFYQAVAAGADLAIGRRMYKFSLRTLSRFVLSRGYVVLMRACLGLPFQDTEAGFKFFAMARMRPVLDRCREAGWFWDTEVIARAHDAGRRIAEVNCLFVRRDDKTSTVQPLRDSWRQARSLLALRRQRHAVEAGIRRYWQEQPERFVRHYGGGGAPLGFLVGRFLRERFDDIASRLKVKPGDLAVDVGCGSGIYALALRDRGARVIGLDYSPSMIRQARMAAPAAREGTWFVVGEATALPVESRSAEAVVCVGLLDYVPDTAGVLAEIARVARVGAQVVVTIPKDPSPYRLLRGGLGLWIRRFLFGLPPIRVAVRREALERLVRRAGLALDSVECLRDAMWIAWCHRAHPAPSEWRPGTREPGAGALGVAAMPVAADGEYPEHVRDWLASIEPRHFWFGSRARLLAGIVRERVPHGGWLELGCGNGYVLAEVARTYRGGPCAGQEVSRRAVEIARTRTSADLYVCAPDDVPLESLGGAGLFDVIEHLDDDVTALRTAAQYVRPGGAVIVTVPAHTWLWSEVDEASGHRRRYSRAALTTALRSAGLRVELCRPFFASLLPGMLLRRSRRRANTGSLLRTALAPPPAPIDAAMRVVGALEVFACRAGLTPIGTSWLAVGRKVDG